MACDQGTDLGPSALASRCSCDALSNPCLRRVPPQGLHRCIAVARLTRLQWALLGGNPVLRLPRPGECRAWTFGPSDSWPDCRANDCYGGARFGGPLDPTSLKMPHPARESPLCGPPNPACTPQTAQPRAAACYA